MCVPSHSICARDAAIFRVARGVYRSSYPTKKTLPFLKQIGVRSIVYLCLEEYTDGAKKFLEENDIQLFPHGTPGRLLWLLQLPMTLCRSETNLVNAFTCR